MTGVDIAEVPAGHGDIHDIVGARPLPHGVGHSQPGPDVVDDLRGDAPDIDGVDRADGVGGLEGRIVVERLDEVLTVVEDAVHRDVVDVGVIERVHLSALDIAHPAQWREHEDGDSVLPPEGVLGG